MLAACACPAEIAQVIRSAMVVIAVTAYVSRANARVIATPTAGQVFAASAAFAFHAAVVRIATTAITDTAVTVRAKKHRVHAIPRKIALKRVTAAITASASRAVAAIRTATATAAIAATVRVKKQNAIRVLQMKIAQRVTIAATERVSTGRAFATKPVTANLATAASITSARRALIAKKMQIATAGIVATVRAKKTHAKVGFAKKT